MKKLLMRVIASMMLTVMFLTGCGGAEKKNVNMFWKNFGMHVIMWM